MSTSTRPAGTGGAGPTIAKSTRGSQNQRADAAFQPNASGIDIGAREIYVAVPPDRDEHPVRKCGTFTSDVDQMADWPVSCGITTVAMESTGVYWIPVYEAVERHGIEACLVNPRNMKNVPGIRTDFHECQWIQHLHSLGLLHAAFRPDSEVRAVRALMRHRNDLVQMASQHVQHWQKALTQMNVQFQHVISDLTGLTGLAILDAILGGERDPAVLAKLRDPRIKADQETIWKSLEGNWRVEHLLLLKQRLSLYRSYRDQINDCDREIEKVVAAFDPKVDPAEKPLPEDRKKRQRQRKKKSGSPNFDMRTESYKLFGVDLTQIPGLMALVLLLFSEVGRDMSRWPTAAHFVSWLGLCPDNDISGGMVLWRGARRTKNRAGTLFRMAASSLYREQAPIGDYLRRMKAKLGPTAGTTATAHKLAVIFYTMVKNQVEYDASLGQNATGCARSGWKPNSTNKPPSAATNSYQGTPPNPPYQQLPYEFLGRRRDRWIASLDTRCVADRSESVTQDKPNAPPTISEKDSGLAPGDIAAFREIYVAARLRRQQQMHSGWPRILNRYASGRWARRFASAR